jgi:hypothetical protein
VGVKGVKIEALTCRLPDGGQIKVTDMKPVQIGDVHTFRQLTYSHAGNDERAACEIVFEVRDGAPVCARLTFTSDSEHGVRAKDLKAMKLDQLCQDVFGYVVGGPNPSGSGVMVTVGPGSYLQDREHVERAMRRRRVTPQLKREVAAVHAAAPERGRMAAVIRAFGVSERQALRYIAAAKRDGFIK